MDTQHVVLIHGIRTQAAWAEMVAAVLEEDNSIKVHIIRYGFFDTLRFLCPFWTRTAPTKRLVREFRDLRSRYPGAKISALAHSFGTYLVARSLKEPDVGLFRVLTCGSVIDDNFRPSQFRGQLGEDPILNDCGTHDIYPVLAHIATWGYGATGTFGFGTIGIRDRFNKFGHGDYFSEDFVRYHWLPFFASGKIVPTEWERTRKAPPYWLSTLNATPLKWILLGAVIFGLSFPIVFRPSAKITLSPPISFNHYIGASNVYVNLTFENPRWNTASFYGFNASLISPDNTTQKMFLDSAFDSFTQQQVFVSQPLAVGPFGTIKLGFSFFDSSIASSIVNQKNREWGAQTSLDSAKIFENKQLIDDKTVEQLNDEFRQKFRWKAGTWRFELHYGVNGKDNTETVTFDVTDEDVNEMKKSVQLYKRGLGVFPYWRLFDQNGQPTWRTSRIISEHSD